MKLRLVTKHWLPLVVFLFLIAGHASFSQTTSIPATEDAVSGWQMFRGSSQHHGMQLQNGELNATPVLKWEYTDPTPPGNNGGGEGEPAIGDINEDGIIEVVSAFKQNVHAINGTTGTLLWSAITGAQINGSPAIADVDTNGSMDVVVCSDKVYALNGNNGSGIWTFTSTPTMSFNSSPAVADVFLGGSPEVIVTCDNGKVYCLNGATGVMIWSYTIININENFWASPVVGDVNGDGQPDVVVVSPAAFNNTGGQVIALNGNTGTVIWTYTNPAFTWDIIPQSPVIADINQDCQMDVLAPQGGTLYIISGSTGMFQDSIYNAGNGTPAVADLDGDCDLEIITGGPRAYNSNGTLIWSIVTGSSGWNAPVPRVGDFNQNSPGLEIVVGNAYDMVQSGPNYLVKMYSSTGVLLWGYKNSGHTCEGIAIGDIDNDGCVEIVVNPDCCNGRSSVLALDDVSGTSNCGSISTPTNLAITASDYSPCVGDSINFMSGADCLSSWTWTFAGGVPSTSALQDPANIHFDTTGTFTIQFTGQLTCGMDTAYLVITVDSCLPTGINTIYQSSFSLSPNPSSGTFNISFGKTVRKGELSVINMYGETVYREEIRGEESKNISLVNISNGIYLVRLNTDGRYFFSKAVIK